MKYQDFSENRMKKYNIEFLSERTKNFIPEISGNFCKDKKYFSKFWENVKLEKKFLKKQKKISRKNIKDINEFCNISKKIFLSKYSVQISSILGPNI